MVPGTVPEKLTAAEEAWWQRTWFERLLTVGIGFTVMLKDLEIPVQVSPALEKDGITVMVAETGVVVVLIAWKEAISPVPLGGRPMDGFEFVQL
jgi:hypothetical protein